MKRCYFFQRLHCPVTIFKYIESGYEEIKTIMSIKESYIIWSKSYENPCLIQRYILPPNNQACKYRVEFDVSENTMVYCIAVNKTDIFGHDNSEIFHSNSINYAIPNEKKFIVNKICFSENKTLEDEILIGQMHTLKKIIESDDSKNQIASLIVADFIQDHQNKWYFINMKYYRFEIFLPKILQQKPKKNKGKSKVSSTTSLPKITISSNISKIMNKTMINNKNLVEEIFKDLEC